MTLAVRAAWNGAIASLVALIFLCLAWELWLAPIRPGGSLLALKVLPLLVPLFGVLRGKRYTLRVVARGCSDHAPLQLRLREARHLVVGAA